MTKTMALAVALVLLASLFLASATFAETPVAVKKGDWIEYNVTIDGNPTPNHNITWARLDIVNVEGSAVTIDFQTQFANGTMWLEPNTTLDISKGVIGEGCLIPTNLTVGDVYRTELEGNITIRGTETLQAGGAQRTVLSGTSDISNQTSYCWDKETGIMVQATTTLPDCIVYTETAATNLWQPKILGLDRDLFFLLLGVIVGVVLALTLFVIWRMRIKKRQ